MKIRNAVAATAIAGVLVAFVPALPASAEAPVDVPITVSITGQNTEVEYGQYWDVSYTAEGWPNWYGDMVIQGTGTPSGWWPGYYRYANGYYGHSGVFGSFLGVAWLAPGEYTFVVKQDAAPFGPRHKGESQPVTLTISPAALEAQVRAVADPASEGNVIVSASLAGRFAEEYQYNYTYSDGSGAPSPAGTWAFEIVDSSDTVVEERTVERPAAGDVFSESFYWTEGVPGEEYRLTSTFTAAPESSANFAVTQAPTATFTIPDEARTVPVAVGEKPTPIDPGEVAGFSVPLWWILLIGLALVALIALTVILAVQLGRSAAGAPAKVADTEGVPA